MNTQRLRISRGVAGKAEAGSLRSARRPASVFSRNISREQVVCAAETSTAPAPAASRTAATATARSPKPNGGNGKGLRAAAVAAPPAPPATSTLELTTAAVCLPHPDKTAWGGEDAHFISTLRGGALGIADGVGGWHESGVNPSEYSTTFMHIAWAFVEGRTNDIRTRTRRPVRALDGPSLDPRGALSAAHRYTRLPGSTTACVMQLDPAKETLHAANLGDSGFIVVRNGRVVQRSKPMEHFFDCPLQMGAFPEHVDVTDNAEDAQCYSLEVQPGDAIILGTDGLWDNCYEADIAALAPRSADEAQAAANKMAKLAQQHANDPRYVSPYIREARRNGYDIPWWQKILMTRYKDGKWGLGELTGGKIDDITVLVSVVGKTEVAPAPAPAAAPAAAEPLFLSELEDGLDMLDVELSVEPATVDDAAAAPAATQPVFLSELPVAEQLAPVAAAAALAAHDGGSNAAVQVLPNAETMFLTEMESEAQGQEGMQLLTSISPYDEAATTAAVAAPAAGPEAPSPVGAVAEVESAPAAVIPEPVAVAAVESAPDAVTPEPVAVAAVESAPAAMVPEPVAATAAVPEVVREVVREPAVEPIAAAAVHVAAVSSEAAQPATVAAVDSAAHTSEPAAADDVSSESVDDTSDSADADASD